MNKLTGMQMAAFRTPRLLSQCSEMLTELQLDNYKRGQSTTQHRSRGDRQALAANIKQYNTKQ